MRPPITFLSRLLREERGATLVEYALMVALIALVAFGSTVAFGTSLQALYQNILDDIVAALP